MDTSVAPHLYQTTPVDDADDDTHACRPRKSKRRLVQLLNLRPGVWFKTAAVIGPPDHPTYVIEIEVDGQVEQQCSNCSKKGIIVRLLFSPRDAMLACRASNTGRISQYRYFGIGRT